MVYKVRRPSETRHRGGPRAAAPSHTTARRRRKGAGAVDPVLGQFFGTGKTPAAKAVAEKLKAEKADKKAAKAAAGATPKK